MTSNATYFEHPDRTGTTRVRTDQQNRSGCIPKPHYSSRRDQQGAATLHKTQQGTVTLVLLYAGNVAGSMATLPFGDGTSLGINNANAEAETAHYAMQDKDFYGSSDSGTNHALFRQYMDTIGSWMSPDPYLGSYDATNPQSMDRYSYAQNNPLGFVDPEGLMIYYNQPGWSDCPPAQTYESCTQNDGGYGWGGGSLDAAAANSENEWLQSGDIGWYWSLGLTGMERTDSIMTFGGSTSDFVLLTPEYSWVYTGPTVTAASYNTFEGGGFAGGPGGCMSVEGHFVCPSELDNRFNLMEKGKSNYRDFNYVCSTHVTIDNSTGKIKPPHQDLFNPAIPLPIQNEYGPNIWPIVLHVLFDATPDYIYKATGHYILPPGRSLCSTN